MKPKAYIFDLDNTLSHPVNRWPYASCQEDEIIPWTMKVLQSILFWEIMEASDDLIQVIILTGRKKSEYEQDTKDWLDKQNLWFYVTLIMNDTSPCVSWDVFKKAKLQELIEKYNILWVFDDDPLVADACKELWIPSFLFSHNH